MTETKLHASRETEEQALRAAVNIMDYLSKFDEPARIFFLTVAPANHTYRYLIHSVEA